MLPRSVNCHDCGEIASVRGYGRIEYDWPETTPQGPETATPIITYVRLTIDCPRCGVKPQDFYPNRSGHAAQPSVTSPVICDATGRRQAVRPRTVRTAGDRRNGRRSPQQGAG